LKVRRAVLCPPSLAERELSQLAAGGMTRDGWNNFAAGWSGEVLRIGTIRAPAILFACAGGGFGKEFY